MALQTGGRPISPSENSIVSSASTVSTANSPARSVASRTTTKTCSSCETVCDWNANICEICGEDFPVPRQVNTTRSATPSRTRPGLWRKPWFFDLSPKQCFDCDTLAPASSAACPICGSENLVIRMPTEGSQTQRTWNDPDIRSRGGSLTDRSSNPLRRGGGSGSGSQTHREFSEERVVWRQGGQFKIRGSDGTPKQVELPVFQRALEEDSSQRGHRAPIFGHLEALFHVVL